MRVLDAQGNPEQKETKQGVQTVDAMPTMQYTEKNIDESRRKCTLSIASFLFSTTSTFRTFPSLHISRA